MPNSYRCELWRVLDKLDRAEQHEAPSPLFDELMSEVAFD